MNERVQLICMSEIQMRIDSLLNNFSDEDGLRFLTNVQAYVIGRILAYLSMRFQKDPESVLTVGYDNFLPLLEMIDKEIGRVLDPNVTTEENRSKTKAVLERYINDETI